MWQRCQFLCVMSNDRMIDDWLGKAPRLSCWFYCSTMKKEAARASETSMEFYRNAGHNIPEDSILHSHRYDSLTSLT
jgi:hypothetical protein